MPEALRIEKEPPPTFTNIKVYHDTNRYRQPRLGKIKKPVRSEPLLKSNL